MADRWYESNGGEARGEAGAVGLDEIITTLFRLVACGVACELAIVHGLTSSDGRDCLGFNLGFVVSELLDSFCIVDGGTLSLITVAAAARKPP